ncbi:Polyisoprenyl-teichoic acid--peptidoglycan teichoic acid transferase TagU [Streptomyces diastaticus subsp. diastaticus]
MTGAGEAGEAGAAGGWSPPTTHRPGPGEGPRRRRRWPWVVLWTVVALAVVVAGAGTALYLWADGRLRSTEAFGEYPGRPKAGRGTDWLLIGSDSRATLTPEQRRELHVGSNEVRSTDTLMIVHEGDHGTTTVSLPRDSYVAIPGHGRGKINSAFALGGPKLLTRTVEQATGLRLDHFAEVDFLGFVDVVDALGGVRVRVPAGGLRDERSGPASPPGARRWTAYRRSPTCGPGTAIRKATSAGCGGSGSSSRPSRRRRRARRWRSTRGGPCPSSPPPSTRSPSTGGPAYATWRGSPAACGTRPGTSGGR